LAIKYLDAKRIRGSSTALAGYLNITQSAGSSVTASVDVNNGSALNATSWVIRFRLTYSAIASGLGIHTFYGIASSNSAVAQGTNRDALGMKLSTDDSGITSINNDNLFSGASNFTPNTNATNSSDWYVDMRRTSANNFTITAYTGSDFSTGQVFTSTLTSVGSGVAALQYFNVAPYVYSSSGSQTAKIRDLKVWNNEQDTDEDPTFTATFVASEWLMQDSSKIGVATTDEKATLVTDGKDGWVEMDSTYISINDTTKRIDFNLVNGSVDNIYKALSVDNAAWQVRYIVNFSAGAGGGSGNGSQYFRFGFATNGTTGGNDEPSTGIISTFQDHSSNELWAMTSAGSTTVTGAASVTVNDTDYYVTLKRTDASNISLDVKTGGHDGAGTSLTNMPLTITDVTGNTGLSHLYIANRESAGSYALVGTVRSIQVWTDSAGTGVPDYEPEALWVKSNLPENTIFEETDTRVIHWLQDDKWIMSSPKGISDLTAWYDASDINSITKNSSNLVSQLNDKSGNSGRNLTASGTSNGGQPLWVSGGKNGLDIVDLTSNKKMRAQWAAKDQPTTICVVLYTPASDGGQDNLWDNYEDGVESSMGFVNSDTNNRLAMFAPANIEYPSSGATTYAQTWTFFVNTYNGSSSSMRINGVEKVTGNCGSNDSFGLTLSTHRAQSSNYGNIKLAEMMVFDKALSSAEIDSVNEYFSRKWGITIGS